MALDGNADASAARSRARPVAAALLGAALGASSFAGGLYDTELWVPAGIVVLLLAAALAFVWPVALDGRTRVALGAAAALGLWQLLSSLWGASPHSAFVEGNRTLVLAGVLGLAVLLARDRRTTTALLVGLAAGVGVVGLATVVQLLAGRTDLFLFDRLAEPLGYTNAQAAVLAMGTWLAFGLASGGSARRAGAATGSATALAALVVLEQSRGAILASLVAALVVLAIARDRRTRLVHLVVALVPVGAASPVLLRIYSEGAEPGRLRWAALAVVLAGVVSGALWGGATAATARAGVDARRKGLRLLTGALAVLAVAGVVVAALNVASIADQVSAVADVGDQPRAGGNDVSRLASGSGNRLDYWRVALDVVADHPLGGVGAGSYPIPYLQDRRTTEVVLQPHSIELQALAETGVVGLLLLLVGLAAVAAALVRLARTRADRAGEEVVTVGAVGAASAYLAHTSVDWLHLIPGVAGMAMVLAAALLTWDRAPESVPVPGARRGVALPVAAAVVLAAALLSLARQGLTERDVRHAQATLSTRPATALDAADGALALDGQDVEALYVRAGALTRLGRDAAADATLRRAARVEPRNFTIWLLLGDAALRRRDFPAALRAYRRSADLNPRDRDVVTSLELVARSALVR